MKLAFGIVLNTVSTVAVVLTNKYLYAQDQFTFMVALSALHFATTSAFLHLRARLHHAKHAKVASRMSLSSKSPEVLYLSLGSLSSVVLMNLNLAYNSVGFYQISKIACIPATVLAQYVVYKTKTSRRVLFCLLLVVIGVTLATVTDVELNPLGSFIASGAVLSTVFAQIWTSKVQSENEVSSTDLLMQTSPIITLGLVGLTVVSGEVTGMLEFFAGKASLMSVLRIAASCLFAIGVNMSNYLVLGKTSPLTYQVLGHFKILLILLLGMLSFQYVVSTLNAIGIALALGGVMLYTEVRRRDTKKSI